MKKIALYAITVAFVFSLAHLYSRSETTDFLFHLAERLREYNIPQKQKTLILRRTAGYFAHNHKKAEQ